MYRLIMDTALDYYYLVLMKDDLVLSETYEKGNSNHSEALMPKLKEVIENEKIGLKDIEEVYIGIGPGSYTGVRVACVIGKMIGAMNKIKAYSFSSLSLLASSIESESYPFIDCRRGNAYISHFVYENGLLKRVMEDKVVKVSEYFNDGTSKLIIKEGKPNPLTLIKSDEVKLVEDINALSPNYLQLVEAERIKKGLL